MSYSDDDVDKRKKKLSESDSDMEDVAIIPKQPVNKKKDSSSSNSSNSSSNNSNKKKKNRPLILNGSPSSSDIDDDDSDSDNNNKKKKKNSNNDKNKKQKESSSSSSSSNNNKKRKASSQLSPRELQKNIDLIEKIKNKQDEPKKIIDNSSSSDSDSDDDNEISNLSKYIEPVPIYDDPEWFKKIHAQWIALGSPTKCWACETRTTGGKQSKDFNDLFAVINDDTSPPSLKDHVIRVDTLYRDTFVDFFSKHKLKCEDWCMYSIMLHIQKHDMTVDKLVSKCVQSLGYQVYDLNQNHLRYRHKRGKRSHINYKASNEFRVLTKLVLDIQKTKKGKN
jgi:hypothetical protein